MNQKIQELIDLSEVWNADGDKCEVDLEKFARLIVEECVSTVALVPPGYKDYRSQIEEAMRDDCVAAVKHKFGIE